MTDAAKDIDRIPGAGGKPLAEVVREFVAGFNTNSLDDVMAYFADDALQVSPCYHCDNDPPVPDEPARLAALRRSVEALTASEVLFRS